MDIWRTPGRAASLPNEAPIKLIASSGDDAGPAYSPDRRRIAFSSARGGTRNVWICDSDGSRLVQLTSFDRNTGTPRWSPDGRWLVFESLETGDWNIYVIDADGGTPRQLTQASATDDFPVWSRDGRWVYFESDRSGRFEIWKIPSEGGQAVQVTTDGGTVSDVSWDGRHLYYSKSGSASGIWRIAVDGSEETEVVRELIDPQNWALGRRGIYYGTQTRAGGRMTGYTIRFLDFESGLVTELHRRDGPFGQRTLAVSPDEEWMLYSEWPWPTAELMLVENFR
jgi:Tol biopolymer transport system component